MCTYYYTTRQFKSRRQLQRQSTDDSQQRQGRSLFDGPIGDRSCDEANVAPTYCECLLSSTSAVKSTSVESRLLTLHVLRKINKKLKNYKG